jgi:hypothetical protein
MGHIQPKTPVHWDNATAVGIANSMVKWKQSCSMDMQFFWISDKCAHEMYALHWHPGQENLADYQSKHHAGTHHAAVRPWYLHESNSLRFLPRAQVPSTLKGCVVTLDGGYLREVPLPYLHKVPLPRAPQLQSTVLVTCAAPRKLRDACYLQVPRIPRWSDLVRSHLGVARSTILPIAPHWIM